MVTQIQSKEWREQEVVNTKVNRTLYKNILSCLSTLSFFKRKNSVVIITTYVWVSNIYRHNM